MAPCMRTLGPKADGRGITKARSPAQLALHLSLRIPSLVTCQLERPLVRDDFLHDVNEHGLPGNNSLSE